MALVGKKWVAVLVRLNQSADATAPGMLNHLYYITPPSGYAPADITTQYPSLTWDVEHAVSGAQLNATFLGQWVPGGTSQYATVEDAMLDTSYYLNGTGTPASQGPGFICHYDSHGWRLSTDPDAPYSGVPSDVYGNFLDNGTLADPTVAPWDAGAGNGLIRYQQVKWYDGHAAEVQTTVYPDVPPSLDGFGRVTVYFTSYDLTYIFMPNDDGAATEPPDGDGDETLPSQISTENEITIRAWGAKLDGHSFYFLRLGDSKTLVFDRLTRQWSEWQSPGRDNLRLHCGQNWVGCIDFFDDGDTDVFAGDDVTPTIWRLNTVLGRDDRSGEFAGTDKFIRVATSMVAANGRQTIPCNAVQLTCALGAPTQVGASITLETSDDLGQTWTNHGAQEMTSDDYSQVLEWRGLGAIREPGRIFRFTDDGATVRFGRAEIR